MASLLQDRASRCFHVRFRYAGQSYKRSLKTRDKREAKTVLSRVDETIRLLERGRLEMPPDADPGVFILSDGTRNGKPKPVTIRTLADLFKMYQNNIPGGTKEETTIQGEKIHIQHLLRHLGRSRLVQRLTVADLQRYILLRSEDTWRGKPIRPATIKKELTTFRLIWNWAVDQEYLSGPAPTKGLKFPKSDEKLPFMTWGEIEAKLARGGLSLQEEAELWSCLFLTAEQIERVLVHAESAARQPFVFPMFVFACHTGARRSEILRSQIDDFDFRTRTVQIREKKKSRSKAMTFRHVPMTDLLHDTMSDWFKVHPGGQFTVCQGLTTVRGKKRDALEPLTPSEARDHFRRTLDGSRWEKIKGFHVFRHSFASNLAAAGVDQRIIDEQNQFIVTSPLRSVPAAVPNRSAALKKGR